MIFYPNAKINIGLNIVGKLDNGYHKIESCFIPVSLYDIIEVKEYKETIVFLRSIAKGIGNRSYGIHVGKMAGLPNVVIDRANEILTSYMINSAEKKNKVSHEMKKVLIKDLELAKSILKEIDLIDINNTTPLQALEILIRLKNRNGS